jgi:hypothetical protein
MSRSPLRAAAQVVLDLRQLGVTRRCLPMMRNSSTAGAVAAGDGRRSDDVEAVQCEHAGDQSEQARAVAAGDAQQVELTVDECSRCTPTSLRTCVASSSAHALVGAASAAGAPPRNTADVTSTSSAISEAFHPTTPRARWRGCRPR